MRKFPLSKPTKFLLSRIEFKKFAFRNRYINVKSAKKTYLKKKLRKIKKNKKIKKSRKKFLVFKKTRFDLFKYYYIFFKQQF